MAEYSNETFPEQQLDRLSKQTGHFLGGLFHLPCVYKTRGSRLSRRRGRALHGADESGWAEPDLPAALHVRSSPACRACLERKRALGGRTLLALEYGSERLVPIFYPIAYDRIPSSPHRWRKSPSFAWINGLTFIALTVLQNRGRPDITGKPHLMEILPFLATLWTLTSTLGMRHRDSVEPARHRRLALFWMSEMARRQITSALRPASTIGDFLVGATSMALACLFSEIGVGG
jgi:hypothetical protein